MCRRPCQRSPSLPRCEAASRSSPAQFPQPAAVDRKHAGVRAPAPPPHSRALAEADDPGGAVDLSSQAAAHHQVRQVLLGLRARRGQAAGCRRVGVAPAGRPGWRRGRRPSGGPLLQPTSRCPPASPPLPPPTTEAHTLPHTRAPPHTYPPTTYTHTHLVRCQVQHLCQPLQGDAGIVAANHLHTGGGLGGLGGLGESGGEKRVGGGSGMAGERGAGGGAGSACTASGTAQGAALACRLCSMTRSLKSAGRGR